MRGSLILVVSLDVHVRGSLILVVSLDVHVKGVINIGILVYNITSCTCEGGH